MESKIERQGGKMTVTTGEIQTVFGSLESAAEKIATLHTQVIGEPKIEFDFVPLGKFALSRYLVTNAQYGKYLSKVDRVAAPKYLGDPRFNQPYQPVVGVSWRDALVFCKWANCRLPTEAEWEYACRAGSRREYCFGDDENQLGDYAWFDKNSKGTTQPVGQKQPNDWGFYDMHGNVWEWCSEFLDGDRVLCGGSWLGRGNLCRSACRLSSPPTSCSRNYGFRVAMTCSGEQR